MPSESENRVQRLKAPSDTVNQLFYYVEANLAAGTLEIRPIQNGAIVLYGPEWAELLIQMIRSQGQRMWHTEPSCSSEDGTNVFDEGIHDTFELSPDE